MGNTKQSDIKSLELILCQKSKIEVLREIFKQFIAVLFSSESYLSIITTGCKGLRNWHKLIEEGYVETVCANYQFSQRTLKNLVDTYDPVTGKMSLTVRGSKSHGK